MEDFEYNLWSLVVSIITLAVGAVGLGATYWQLNKVRESNWSTVHSTLCDQSFEIIKLCADKPTIYDYFYNRRVLAENEPDKVYVYLVAEAFANFMEQLILQKKSLPSDQWKVWKRFIDSTFRSSIVIGDFIRNHREWYSKELLKAVDEGRLKYN